MDTDTKSDQLYEIIYVDPEGDQKYVIMVPDGTYIPCTVKTSIPATYLPAESYET